MKRSFDDLSSDSDDEKPLTKPPKIQRTLSAFGFNLKKTKGKKRPAKSDSDLPPAKKARTQGLVTLPKPNKKGLEHNERTAKVLEEMGKFESIKGDRMRATAYSKAALALRGQDKPIRTRAEAQKIFGIGKKIALKIENFVTTGTLDQLEKRRNDPELQSIMAFNKVFGIGPKTAKQLYAKGYRTLDDLRANNHELNAKQRLGLKYVDDIAQRIPREEVKAYFEFVKKEIKRVDPGLKAECCGSYRRGLETSGDVDILITHQSGDKKSFKKLVQNLKSKNFLVAELSFGPTKFLGIGKHPDYDTNRRIDLLYYDIKLYYTALIWYTGSGIFNRQLNTHCGDIGMQITENGLFELTSEPGAKKKVKGKAVHVRSEKEAFERMGLTYMEPEDRDWGK